MEDDVTFVEDDEQFKDLLCAIALGCGLALAFGTMFILGAVSVFVLSAFFFVAV